MLRPREWKPKKLPNGLDQPSSDAHRITNDWADHLYDFNKEVYEEFHTLGEAIEKLEKRIKKLEGSGPAQPTATTNHISQPPPPPFE